MAGLMAHKRPNRPHHGDYNVPLRAGPEAFACVVRNTVKLLRDVEREKGEITTVVVTGVSGLLVGSAVCSALGLPITVVRKGTEASHSVYNVEGCIDFSNAVILDDFISSGQTLQNCINALNTTRQDLNIVAFVMYDSCKIHGRSGGGVHGMKNLDAAWREVKIYSNFRRTDITRKVCTCGRKYEDGHDW